jgi:hypothetical protein
MTRCQDNRHQDNPRVNPPEWKISEVHNLTPCVLREFDGPDSHRDFGLSTVLESSHMQTSGVKSFWSVRSSDMRPPLFNGHDELRLFGLQEFSTLHSSTLLEYFFSGVQELETPVLTNG